MDEFLEFRLQAESLAVCERIKKANYRPCLESLPSSTVAGVLRENLGVQNAVGIGFLEPGTYRRASLVYSPRERFGGSTKFPISMEYLEPADSGGIRGQVFVMLTPDTERLTSLKRTPVLVGALRYKGLGRATLTFSTTLQPKLRTGVLRARLREDEKEYFGIQRVLKRVPGYLFRPTSRFAGFWTPALFEGSIVTGYEFLLGEDYIYDFPNR